MPKLRSINKPRPISKPRPIKRRADRWSVYNLKHAPAQFVGIIENAPNEQTAIDRAIEKYQVLPNERGRLVAYLRRG
jgi:hypothetical protein